MSSEQPNGTATPVPGDLSFRGGGPFIPPNVRQPRQLRMGPAPFASFEDLSDEVRSQHLESPEDKQSHVIRLPGIHEDPTTPGGSSIIDDSVDDVTKTGISLIGAAPATSVTTSGHANPPISVIGKLAPCTPRIDISRASSSSHHEDSHDSTPDNQEAIPTLGLGFREEGTLELRSSTEELDFHDAQEKATIIKSRPNSPLVFICDPNFDRQRKDSQTSEICLLSISGRTSRLSSIGSQCSDQSRISTASHLSVMSGHSAISRSTSPHKMLLETSFCGSKPNLSEIHLTDPPPELNEDGDVLEKVLLARKHDPREAILAEGISIETSKKETPQSETKPVKKPAIPKPARTSLQKKQQQLQKQPKSEEANQPQASTSSVPTISINEGQTVHDVKYDSKGQKLIPGQVYKTECGVEYIYIPLKGPLPKDFNKPNSVPTARKKTRETSSAPVSRPSASTSKTKSSASAAPSSAPAKKEKEPEYIWIKLKPDHMYNQDGTSKPYTEEEESASKPMSLDLKVKKTENFSASPSTSRVQNHQSNNVDLNKIHMVRPSSSPINIPKQSPVIDSTVSPSLSRRSSLFKSRETISPESGTPTPTGKQRKSVTVTLTAKLKETGDVLRDRNRSRSKSRERDWSPAGGATTPGPMSSTESIDTKHKQKSSVFSIFKSKKTPTKPRSTSAKSSSENLQYDGITNVEFKFDSNKRTGKYYEQPLEGDSIIIPLHSPSEYLNRTIVSTEPEETDSKPTESTVEQIEMAPLKKDSEEVKSEKIEKRPSTEKITPPTPDRVERKLKHHTSTSSENMVFSTKLGSNEEIFTTKLPKKPQFYESRSHRKEEETVALVNQVIVSPKETPHIESTPSVSSPPVQPTKKISTPPKDISIEKTEEAPIIQKSDSSTKPPTPITSSIERASSSQQESNRDSVASGVTGNEETSENSENDSELEFINKKKLEARLKKKREEQENESVCEDHERKTLVFQTDSFDDELPYVPTTLPLERSVAIPIVPVKQRTNLELKTYPIERPRSTTPINPSCIDDYYHIGDKAMTITRKKTTEKLKISLPREDTMEKIQKLKSPRKTGSNPRAWQEFAEKGISSHQSPSSTSASIVPLNQSDSNDEPPPPLPPRGTPKEPPPPVKQWINFEEIPEKHKPPKRIQTIPSRGHIDVPDSVLSSTSSTTETVIYNYVNPEDCQCECHEAAAASEPKIPLPVPAELSTVEVEEAEAVPLLQDDEDSDDTMKMSSSSSSYTKR